MALATGFALVCLSAVTATAQEAQPAALDVDAASRFAQLALKCLHQEYPNHVQHMLDSAADALPPHELTPAFYGCLDWHSDVHGHWLLVRLVRMFPQAPFATQARTELARSHAVENSLPARAVVFLRHRLERPYGLAWLLQLSAELRQWQDPQASQWSATPYPLEAEGRAALEDLDS